MGTFILLLVKFISFYKWVLFARIILSWLNVAWHQPPFSWLHMVTEPVLAPFRSLIPPIGGMDLSPILLFFAIDLLAGMLSKMAFY